MAPYEPRIVDVELSVADGFRAPDSASWSLRSLGGSARLVRAPHSDIYRAEFEIPQAPGADRVLVSLWRDGLRTNVLRCQGDAALRFDPESDVEKDPVAYAVLRRRELLSAKDPAGYPDDASGARRALAKMLVERDSATRGALEKGLPFGVDTAALADEICRAMAASKKSFDSLWTREQLGGDSAAWAEVVKSRVARKILDRADSARLFPPVPVRVESPLAVARKLVAGGDEIAVDGSFGWFPGLVALDAFVLSGKDTVRGMFDVALEQPRRKTDTAWSLVGRANVRARSKAPKGAYVLGVVARDAKGRRAVATTPLEVVEPAPGTPRLSRIEPDGGDTAKLSFETASLHVAFKVLNPEDLDESSVTIGGAKAKKRSATEWEGEVAVPPTGRPVIVAMRAVGKNGEPGADYLLAVRSGDPVPPRLDSIDGSGDRTVPFGTASAVVRWKAWDNHKVDLVEIGGVEATLTDSVYSRTVPLAVGENLVETEAYDSSRNVARKVARIVRSRDEEAPHCVRDLGAHDTDISSASTKFVLMGWLVTDNHKVESVTIGGVAADRSASFYYRLVPVQTGETKVAMVARDSSGNQSTDTVLVRKEPNPGYPVLKALPGTESRTVPFETTHLVLGWRVLNPRSLDEVTISGIHVDGVEGVFEVDVALPVGDTVLRIVATDTLGVPTKAEEVVVSRRKDTIPPSLAQGSVRFATVAGITRADVGWVVEDNHRLAVVTIDGKAVVPVGNVYSTSLEVPAGQDKIRIEAEDSCGNRVSDEVAVDRTPDTHAPELAAGVGAQDREVEAGVEMTLVAWTVSDDQEVESVVIAGMPVYGKNGLYATYVPLEKGANTIKIVAKDPSGNEASDEVVITRN